MAMKIFQTFACIFSIIIYKLSLDCTGTNAVIYNFCIILMQHYPWPFVSEISIDKKEMEIYIYNGIDICFEKVLSYTIS